MFSLEKLCIDLIVQKFERFYFAFTVSEVTNHQRNFEFLQRRYSSELARELYAVNKLKEEYFEFLINEHLDFLDGDWFRNSRYQSSMKDIFRRLPNLTKISFKFCDDEIPKNIAKFCPKIVEIDLNDSYVTDNGVKNLCENKTGMVPCPNIKIISIQNSFVTVGGAELLVRNLPSLEKIVYPNIPVLLFCLHEKNIRESGKIQFYNLIELQYCGPGNLLEINRFLTDIDVLKTCFTVCPKLKSLDCYISDEEQLNLFVSRCLKKLRLQCRRTSFNIDNFLKLNAYNLTYLDISYCTMSVSLLSAHCPLIKEFFAQKVDFTNDDEDDLKLDFASLTECSFRYVSTKGVCLILSSAPKLESIRFESCSVSLPLEMKTRILSWCENPSAKKIELSYMNLEIEFLRDILLNSASLKEMWLEDQNFYPTDPEMEEMREILQSVSRSLPNKPQIIFY